MPTVQKEVIRPGCYWYKDADTDEPRKLTVTPELTKYWCEQGNAMLSAGLTVPVPFEHDFDAHPMTPAEKLKNNAGWVDKYYLEGDKLFSAVNIQDTDVAKRLPGTIRWTSPWINSFTDGSGREWKNVISHLALTTRPRIVEQAPFGSIAAALGIATPIKSWDEAGSKGVCLSRAGMLGGDGKPLYPMAFSLLSDGVTLGTDASGHSHDATGKFTSVNETSGKTSHKSGAEVSADANESTRKANDSNIPHHHRYAANMHRGAASYLHGVGEHGLAGEHEAAATAHQQEYDNHKDASLSVDATFAWSEASRKAAAESRKRNAASRKANPSAYAGPAKPRAKRAGKKADDTGAVHAHTITAHEQTKAMHESPGAHGDLAKKHISEALRSSGDAEYQSKNGRHGEAGLSHHRAAQGHVAAAKIHHMRGDHEGAYRHAEAANSHFQAAKHHFDAHSGKAMSVDAAFGFPPKKAAKGKPPKADDDADPAEGEGSDFDAEDGEDDLPSDGDPSNDGNIDLEPFGDPAGDVQMEELLCDLLGALGIHCENGGNEEMFKRNLYNAAMTKIHELAGKGDANQQPNRTNPPGQPPNNPKLGASGGQPNPLIQQEQQPMFMSLEEIKKLDEPLRSVALSMHDSTVKANAKAAEAEKLLNSLRDGKLKEATEARVKRAGLIGRFMPRAKPDLDAMLAMPAMALSMGDGGTVVDPMAATLAVLEKGLADLPRLLTTDASALSVQPQPQDADMLTAERVDEIADGLARQMGCAPLTKAS